MSQRMAEITDRRRASTPWLQQGVLNVGRHWLAWINLAWGVLVGLPWLAPILMKVGATGPALIIYSIYSSLCHQLANRSFFLFGPKVMYSYTELLPYAPGADTWLGLRAFIGTSELGYKVAWSDRMVSLYGGILLGGLIFALLRHRLKPLSWRKMVIVAGLMLPPMILDGVTHWISDLVGLGVGFRYDNAWLAALTGNVFSQAFYVGNALGSFNFWMRLITGLLFGLGGVWLTYPLVEMYFRDVLRVLKGS